MESGTRGGQEREDRHQVAAIPSEKILELHLFWGPFRVESPLRWSWHFYQLHHLQALFERVGPPARDTPFSC